MWSMTAVLVGEHNLQVAAPLSDALRSQGYDVALVEDGPSVLRSAASGWAGLVVLDADLPDGSGGSGLEVVRALRTQASDLPVIMVSDAHEETDAVSSLDAGADDFLALPLRHDEVLARIRALLRRSVGHAKSEFTCGPVRLDSRTGRVSVDGNPVKLTSHEYRLLSYLMHHTGRVVSRTELVEHLYDQDFDRDSNTIEVFVGRIRKKLGVDVIQTVRGLGYLLSPPAA
jgi:two-component system, OmpR family, response regulator